MRRALAVVLLVAACRAGAPAPDAGTPAVARPAPATHVVTIHQMAFQPPELAIHPGDTVEWKNDDMFQHTATAADHSFDSGVIDPGKTWRVVITKPGTVAYACTLHPTMKGAVTVK